ncbi:MAG: conjugal transfer protein TraL, partial [Oscillospiraceae bacterium]
MQYAALLLLAALGTWLFSRVLPGLSRRALILCALGLIASMALRAVCLWHVTYDYIDFLRPWMDRFREGGGLRVLGQSVGDYSPPYLVFLALISYLDYPDLILIKLFSVLFDLLLAWTVMRIVLHASKDLYDEAKARRRAAAGFFAALFFPTVILNSAYWGQCDSIYAFFALTGLYQALNKRPWLSVAFFAISFSLKLQAVFILPIILVLLVYDRIKLRHLPVFPAVWFVSLLPAAVFGRPLGELFTLYIRQAGQYKTALSFNAPSVFVFAPGNIAGTADKLGIAASFLFMLLVLLIAIWGSWRREELSDHHILFTATALCAGIPFLLPFMHERYWYLADVLSVALACLRPRDIPLAGLMLFGSFSGYHAYLVLKYAYDMRAGAACIALAALLALAELVFEKSG